MTVYLHAFQLGTTGECIIADCLHPIRDKDRLEFSTAPARALPDYFYFLRYLEMAFIGGRAEPQLEAPRVLDIKNPVNHGIQFILSLQFKCLELRAKERRFAVPRLLPYKTRIRRKHEPFDSSVGKRFNADLLEALAKVHFAK